MNTESQSKLVGYVVVSNRCELCDDEIFETSVEASLEMHFRNLHDRARGPWCVMAINGTGARA